MGTARGIPLHPPDGQRYRFDAGALCLELLLTGGEGDLAVWESLHAPAGLVEWVLMSRLAEDTTVDPQDVAVTEEELREVRALRSAVQRAVLRHLEGRPVDPHDADVVDAMAAYPPPIPRLGFRRTWATPITGRQVLSAVARDAIDVLCGATADRVRMCAGADCRLIFLDTSRPGRRRWCSMDRCGNRHKLRTRKDRGHPARDAVRP